MSAGQASIDLDGVVDALCALGSDEIGVRDQLALCESDAERLSEIAALAVESELGLLLARGDDLDAVLFELVEALRQAGAALAMSQTASGPALVLGDVGGERVYEITLGTGASVDDLVAAIVELVPAEQRVLVASDYEAEDALALVVLPVQLHEQLRRAAGDAALDAVLVSATPRASAVAVLELASSHLLAADFQQRFGARQPDDGIGVDLDAIWARLSTYDARVAWPDGHRRPPGDTFFELTSALAGVPLAQALASSDPAPLANLLYRFALATTTGAFWDVCAARQNPGMSAQGVLGMGQLAWSWFIFDALGATQEAARAGRLLDHEWVRTQERGTLAARQRAWFDLGAFLRTGEQGRALGRVRELLPLARREGWLDAAKVAAALAVHTEPRGDQLTHNVLYHVWPAPLHALARRAGARDLLPSDPFLSRALDVSMLDRAHPMLQWLDAQLARFDGMDESTLPPLLDPLPVIVDVRVTEVDAHDAHGRTLLAAREDAEHHVVAPHRDRGMKPGEIWLFEVQSALPSRVRVRHDDLGEVSLHIAVPTGEWIARAEGTSPSRAR